jgi:hypothetical protein
LARHKTPAHSSAFYTPVSVIWYLLHLPMLLQLQEDAFNTDSEDDDAFQANYLQQAQPAAHDGGRAITPSAAAVDMVSEHHQQQQHTELLSQELPALPPPQLQQQQQAEQQLQQQQNTSKNSSSSNSCPHENGRQGPPTSADAVAADADAKLADPHSAGSSAAASAGGLRQVVPADRPPGTPPAASSWGLFGRKAAAVPVPVYVPLLASPVNALRHHQADTRMALTIAVNGCISCMEVSRDEEE